MVTRSLGLLFGSLAPSTALASTLTGVSLGFSFGDMLLDAFERGTILEEQRNLIDKQLLLSDATRSLRNTQMNAAINDLSASATFEVARVQNKYIQSGVNINAGTASDTAQKTKAMIIRHGIISIAGV